MATKNNETHDNGMAVAGGALAGLAALAALAGAGYYFYASKDAVKHRKQLASWMVSFKKDVIRELRKLPKVDADSVGMVVDTVAKGYQSMRSVDLGAMTLAVAELKQNWEKLAAEVAAPPARKTAKRSAAKKKKATKKSA